MPSESHKNNFKNKVLAKIPNLETSFLHNDSRDRNQAWLTRVAMTTGRAKCIMPFPRITLVRRNNGMAERLSVDMFRNEHEQLPR